MKKLQTNTFKNHIYSNKTIYDWRKVHLFLRIRVALAVIFWGKFTITGKVTNKYKTKK